MGNMFLPFQTKLIDEFSNWFKKESYQHNHQLIGYMLSLHVESNLKLVSAIFLKFIIHLI